VSFFWISISLERLFPKISFIPKYIWHFFWKNKFEVINMKNIGVQKGLSTLVDYLSRQGYSVKELGENVQNDAQNGEFDAIVVADYNNDVFGYSDTLTNAPVINASGLTEEEVKNQLERHWSK
jgi:hypothetical protein